MPRIAGITTKKNEQGKITHVTINVQKHSKEITPLLQQLGVIEKTQFQMECEKGYTIEQGRARSHKHIDDLWKKKK